MANPFLELTDREPWGPGAFEMALPLVEEVAIRPGMRVLEVGGGSGQSAVTLAKHWNATVFTLEPWFGGDRIQARAAAEDAFDGVIAPKLGWRRVDSNHRPEDYETSALPLSYAATEPFRLAGGLRPKKTVSATGCFAT
jgi:hypothetical protein